MNTTLISIVIITLNEESRIGSCLEALLPQIHDSEFEVIVVDGGSSDGTIDVVARLGRAFGNLRIIQAERSGYGFQRNAGIIEARGRYVMFLSGDAVPAKSCIHHYRSNLKDDVILQGIISYPQGSSYWLRSLAGAVQRLYSGGIRTSLSKFSTVNNLIPRKLLVQYPFDDTLSALEDKAWYRVQMQRHPLEVVRASVEHPIHEGLLGYARKVFREARSLGKILSIVGPRELLAEDNLFGWPVAGIFWCPLLVLAFTLLLATELIWGALALPLVVGFCLRHSAERRLHDTVLSTSMFTMLLLIAGTGFLLGYTAKGSRNGALRERIYDAP